MSNFIPNKTIIIDGLNLSEQYFLYSLNKLALQNRIEFLPNEVLADLMRVSVRTIVRYIRKLEKMEVIKCEYSGELKNHRTIIIQKRVVEENEI